MRLWVVNLMLLAEISGCGGGGEPAPEPGVINIGVGNTKNLLYQEVTSADQIGPGDRVQVIIDMVQISAPAGSISKRAAFWEMVNAGSFSSDFRQVLDSNGMRTGVMAARDWPEARKALELAPGVMSQVATLAGTARATVNSQRFAQETIFYFDQGSHLQGRSYEDADNFWGVFFASDPARAGNVRMELAPVIRSTRRTMRLNRIGDEYQLEYEQPESVLDVAIKASLPLGSVLVVAPSDGAIESSTSVGRAFLTKEELGGLSEQVLFFYPRVYRLSAEGSAKMQHRQDEQEKADDRAAAQSRARESR